MLSGANLAIGLLAGWMSGAHGLQPAEKALWNARVASGSEVKDAAGTVVAELDELRIDRENGRVRSVVLSLVERGGKVVIPWSRFIIEDDGSARIDATAEELRTISGEVEASRAPAPRVGFAPTEDLSEEFDPARVDTYRGIVVGRAEGAARGPAEHVVVVLDIEGDEVLVHLAPEWFLRDSALDLSPGASLVVRGAPVGPEGEEIVLATELVQGESTIRLRSSKGRALWRDDERP